MLRRDFLRTLMGAFVAPVIPKFTVPTRVVIPESQFLGIEGVLNEPFEEVLGPWHDILTTTIRKYEANMNAEAERNRRLLKLIFRHNDVVCRTFEWDVFSRSEDGLAPGQAVILEGELLDDRGRWSLRPGSKATGRVVPLLPAPAGIVAPGRSS